MKFDARRVAIRVDASDGIGSGHVMRCINLAIGLRHFGLTPSFICREHPNNLIAYIRDSGFEVFPLPLTRLLFDSLNYETWCGGTYIEDALQTIDYLKKISPQWVVVDHYGIGFAWERLIKNYTRAILSIDDLANRFHDCDILLDQNYFQNKQARYCNLVPEYTMKLLGPAYALLSSDFPLMREIALGRRGVSEINNLLIFISGSDPLGHTQAVIEAILASSLNQKRIDVVVGSSHQGLEKLNFLASKNSNIQVHIQTKEMATLMTQADFAITGGGIVTWEKCALGLPSLTVVLSENQSKIAFSMAAEGVHSVIDARNGNLVNDCVNFLNQINLSELNNFSRRARLFCDGGGVRRVIQKMGF